MWGYPYRAADKRIKRSVHPPHRGISVITPLPFGGGVGGGAALSHVLLFLSQNYTDEQNTQGFTETLSQPITQNLTAIFSWNVLWYLYAEGVLWTRNAGGKVLLNLWVLWEKEIPSVREKDTLCEKKEYPPCEKELPSVKKRTPLHARKNSLRNRDVKK